MDKFKNNEQNNHDIRATRDNFRNIRGFMNDQSYGVKDSDEEQIQRNRDLRDNFRNFGNKDSRFCPTEGTDRSADSD